MRGCHSVVQQGRATGLIEQGRERALPPALATLSPSMAQTSARALCSCFLSLRKEPTAARGSTRERQKRRKEVASRERERAREALGWGAATGKKETRGPGSCNQGGPEAYQLLAGCP